MMVGMLALNRAPLAVLSEIWRLWLLCYAALDGLRGGGAGFDPVGWKEFVELP
jgi:hypothetical protein